MKRKRNLSPARRSARRAVPNKKTNTTSSSARVSALPLVFAQFPPTRTTPTLLNIPLEIRNKIYTLILAPTSFIVLEDALNEDDHLYFEARKMPPDDEFRYHAFAIRGDAESLQTMRGVPGMKVSILLLRVCKQIYAESKPVFWKENTMVLRSWPPKLGRLDSFVGNLQHATLVLRTPDPTACFNEETVEQSVANLNAFMIKFAIAALGIEAKSFSLVLGGQYRGYDSMYGLLDVVGSKEFFSLLAEAGGKDGFMTRFDRKIIFNVGLEENSRHWHKGEEKGFDRKLRKTAKKLNEAFGGELFRGDKLYFKRRVPEAELSPMAPDV